MIKTENKSSETALHVLRVHAVTETRAKGSIAFSVAKMWRTMRTTWRSPEPLIQEISENCRGVCFIDQHGGLLRVDDMETIYVSIVCGIIYVLILSRTLT